MTSIELTSGEIMDIIDCIQQREADALKDEKMHLYGYYHDLAESFRPVIDKLNTLPGEHRIAKLVMAV